MSVMASPTALSPIANSDSLPSAVDGATAYDQRDSSFLGLPAEIRNSIYAYTLSTDGICFYKEIVPSPAQETDSDEEEDVDNDLSELDPDNDCKPPVYFHGFAYNPMYSGAGQELGLPALFAFSRTCKQIHNETHPLIFKLNTFELGIQLLARFAATVPEQVRKQVKELNIGGTIPVYDIPEQDDRIKPPHELGLEALATFPALDRLVEFGSIWVPKYGRRHARGVRRMVRKCSGLKVTVKVEMLPEARRT